MDVKDAGEVVDGIDRVVDRRVDDGQVAGHEADRRPVGADGGQDGLVPLQDRVGRGEVALLQRFHVQAAGLPAAGSAPTGSGQEGAEAAPKRHSHHDAKLLSRGARSRVGRARGEGKLRDSRGTRPCKEGRRASQPSGESIVASDFLFST
jgi:hypothetical protein